AQRRACRPPALDIPCKPESPADRPANDESERVPSHYWVRTVWEFRTMVRGQEQWRRLDPGTQQVMDDTRAFTLEGRVVVRVPNPVVKKAIGQITQELYYLRCRFEAGA